MALHSPAETIESHGCAIVLRRIEGAEAHELFIHCQPPVATSGAGRQSQAIYSALNDLLAAEGAGAGSLVSETVFLRNIRDDIEAVRTARRQVLAAGGKPMLHHAVTEIEQPPLNDRACLEVSVQAVLPRAPAQVEPVTVEPACNCAECARAHGLKIRVGDEARFYAGALCGAGESAYEQTLGMFGLAEKLLQQAGMAFSDVVRAWIHLREMDRDYPDLNRARREFFASRGIEPVPASTGIGGEPAGAVHHLCLGIYAVKRERPLLRTVMTSPTLNEASQYGADFVRGMRVAESNKDALYVSGTASVDEAGRTAHVGDFDAQAERMLVNVAALLEGQGATFKDVVSAVTYLKRPADAGRLREQFHAAGFEGFPNAIVEARVCRPELLCETEVVAVLPRADTTPPGHAGGDVSGTRPPTR